MRILHVLVLPLILTQLFATVVKQELPENYIQDLQIKQLDKVCQEQKYMVVYFEDQACQSAKCMKRGQKFLKLARKNEKRQILFARVGVTNIEIINQNSKFSISHVPQFSMCAFGRIKNFSEINIRHLGIWVREIFSAMPVYIENLDQVEDIDKHYFVFYDKADLTEDDFEVILLSKLVHPLTVYYGVDEQENEHMKLLREKSDGHKFFSFRASDNKLFKLEPKGADLYKLSNRIKDLEFPRNCKLDKRTMVYITHYKLPTVIYFDVNPRKQEFYKDFKRISKKFKKYLMFCTFDYRLIKKSKDPDLKFYANILSGGISKEKHGMLRIVTYNDNLSRYKTFGNLDYDGSVLFVQNFLRSNLPPLKAVEDLGPKDLRIRKDGLRRINSLKFDQMTKHKFYTHLVYVYSSRVTQYSEHLKILQRLQFALGTNQKFTINILNHDKNDLDGNVHEDLPYLFISNHLLHRKLYEGEFTFRGIFTFLAENLLWLNMNPEFVKEMAAKRESLIAENVGKVGQNEIPVMETNV